MSASAVLGAEGLNLLLERVAELQHALEDGTRRQSAREARMLERIDQVECVDREQRTAITRRVEEIAMSATAFTTTSSSSSAAGGTGSTVAAAQMLVEMDELQDNVVSEVKVLLKAAKTRHDDLKETTTSRLSVLEQSVAQLRQAATAAAAASPPPSGLGRRRSSLSHARASLRGGLVDSNDSSDDGGGGGGAHHHHHHHQLQQQQQRLDALEHEVRDINANITEALRNLRAGEAAAAAAPTPALHAASPVAVGGGGGGGGGGVLRREVALSA
eukprot:Rhum_TRINITY_DN13575_c0_g1::Rhum_TRINITY_DN13575_c0_g1_i1::g.61416::m.61416